MYSFQNTRKMWLKNQMKNWSEELLRIKHIVCEDGWETHSNPQIKSEAPPNLYPPTTEVYHFEPQFEDCEKAVDTFWHGNEKNKEHWKEGYLHTVFLLMLAGY